MAISYLVLRKIKIPQFCFNLRVPSTLEKGRDEVNSIKPNIKYHELPPIKKPFSKLKGFK
jgi:hypothetical protein